MRVIVPAAGLSTRFPNLPPKYLLKDNNNRLMLHCSIENYLDKYSVTVAVLHEHCEKYDSLEIIKQCFGNSVSVVIIPQVTRGPADTVKMILEQDNYELDFLVKDCDSYFQHQQLDTNYVCVHTSNKFPKNKSYVRTFKNQIIDIVEKKIISSHYCVGAYKFNSAQEYLKVFDTIDTTQELFVSAVIHQMIKHKHLFYANECWDYSDVGTIQDWNNYNEKIITENSVISK